MQRNFQRICFFLLLLIFGQCEYKDVRPGTITFDCSQTTLSVALVSKQDATACNLIDGNLVVAGKDGNAPYSFNINGGEFQSDPSFSKLGPGVYTIMIKDATLCTKSVQVDISYPDATLVVDVAVSEDNQCLTDNGSINLTASGGTGPYTFQFGSGSFDSVTSFSNLKFGSYTITVKDAQGCPKAINVTVPRGNTHVSYDSEIKPIITTKCAVSGCHNGDNGASRNWTDFATLQKNAQNVKVRTGNKSMPLVGSLTQAQIDLIACWVDDGANAN